MLDGAFAVLDALAHADDGLGLTALARASGLAKTSAYRLAEQLVDLGAVQRVDGATTSGHGSGASGSAGSPTRCCGRPRRRRCTALAVQSRAMASLRILHEDRLRVICTTMPHGHAYMPNPADRRIDRPHRHRARPLRHPTRQQRCASRLLDRARMAATSRVHPRPARDRGRPSRGLSRHLLRVRPGVVAQRDLCRRGDRCPAGREANPQPARPRGLRRAPHRSGIALTGPLHGGVVPQWTAIRLKDSRAGQARPAATVCDAAARSQRRCVGCEWPTPRARRVLTWSRDLLTSGRPAGRTTGRLAFTRATGVRLEQPALGITTMVIEASQTGLPPP